CHDVVTKMRMPFNVPSGDEGIRCFWTSEAPALFCEALDRAPENAFPRYDAVLVDEAQDFHQDWWFPIQLMLHDPDHGRLCLFSDPEQTPVYGKGDAFPAGLVSFDLAENCRNTKRITSYCGNVLTLKM